MVLDLGGNLFEGTFPGEVGRCPSLRRMIISNNNLSGTVPNNLTVNTGILYLDMKMNSLEGSIPPSLGLWKNITFLDMSYNQFSGAIPAEFGKLSELHVLILSSNRLTGNIPSELGNCSKIFKLDLSRNSFTGSISLPLLSLTKLQDLNLQGNNITGQIPDSISGLQELIQLQLGENKLEGHIPSALGNLRSLSLVLNISNNHLSGGIPPNLGNLKELQYLDLSYNQLSGIIPSELDGMLSLSSVNVSYNQLSGMLPSSWLAFVTASPSSFLGNPGLCLTDKLHLCKSEGQSDHRNTYRRNLIAHIIIAIAFSLAGLCCLGYLVFISLVRLRWARQQNPTMELLEDSQQVLLKEIMQATAGMSEKFVIGKGKHGIVYKAAMPSGRVFAVKKLILSEKGLSNTSLKLEIDTLGTIRHRNLVKIVAFCEHRDCGLIVYEYMCNGSLHDILHQVEPPPILDWDIRYNIAVGIANGLAYLHHDCVPKIIHRDIKSCNILLDSQMVPHIGDFGLAKLIHEPEDTNVGSMSCVVGTLGYIAPEIAYSLRVTEKSDVYSYGVVLLELLTRKMAVDPCFEDGDDIVRWVKQTLEDSGNPYGVMDEVMDYWMENDRDEAAEVLGLALNCCESMPDARPSMREVVDQLVKVKSRRRHAERKDNI